MEFFLKDLKQSFRSFRHNPGFTITAVAALGLGIGANTAIFSVVNAVLLKPVAAPEPQRVVAFMNTNAAGSVAVASEIKFNLWREQTNVFQEVSGYYPGTVNLTGSGEPQLTRAMFITADYFRLFGLAFSKGRGFTDEEERPHGPNVVVLSAAFWKRAFGGDPRTAGRLISLDGHSYQVVGIIAGDIQPETVEAPDVWLPFPIEPNSNSQLHYFQALGRLKPGVTFDAANARLQLVTQEFRRKFPDTVSAHRGDSFSVEPVQDVIVRGVRRPLLILTAAVSLVLLIACANVANLLLVRAAGRTREMAIRVAIGASKTRIIRQLLTESVLLSMAGGLLGLMLGLGGIRALLALSPTHIPRIGADGSNVTMDWRVLTFTLLVALLTGLLFGLFPALQVSSTELNSNLKESSGRNGTGCARNRTGSALVIGEISLALLLSIGAALLIRTLVALRSVNPGFNTTNVLTTRTPIDPRSAKKTGTDQIVQDVFRRLSALPGVETAGYTRLLPLGGDFNSIPVVVAGRPLSGPSHGSIRWMVVSSSYFEVLKIPLVRGRRFTDTDRLGSPGVAIVNQAMARQFWPGGDPIGAQLIIGKGLGANFEEPARQIIGVVADVHDNGLGESPQPAVFVAGAQLSEARTAGRTVAWVVRISARSQLLDSAILNGLHLATGEPVPPLRSMEEIALRSSARQDFNMILMSFFAGSALLLAAIGIYGVMAYNVQQRTREMGVRMALGAQSAHVRNLVVFQGLRLVFAGIAIGLAAAAGLTRFLASVLFGVQALDPLVLILAPVLLGTVALASVWLPAHRASRIDPINALQCE